MRGMSLKQLSKQFDQVVAQTSQQQALQIANGGIKDMNEYNRKVGRVQGLQDGAALLKQMVEALEDSESQGQLGDLHKQNLGDLQ